MDSGSQTKYLVGDEMERNKINISTNSAPNLLLTRKGIPGLVHTIPTVSTPRGSDRESQNAMPIPKPLSNEENNKTSRPQQRSRGDIAGDPTTATSAAAATRRVTTTAGGSNYRKVEK